MSIKKDAYYFPHFSNARNDRKIKRLRKELHAEGYGIYFMLLEVLRDQDGFIFPLSDVDLLADDLGTSEQKVKTIICNYGLFEIDENGCFFSPKMIEYLDPYLKKSARAREAADIRWGNKKLQISENEQTNNANAYANALHEHSKCNADKNASKVKYSKEELVKESIEGDNPPDSTLPLSVPKKPKNPSGGNKKFVAPTIDEVLTYFSEFGFSEDAARKAFIYYQTGNWFDSKGNPVRNWKQKMQSVWFKDENRIKPQVQTAVNTLTHLPNAKTIVDKYR